MKVPQFILVVILSCVAAYGTVFYLNSQKAASGARASVYDSVLKSGTIRCGYAEWPPLILVKDAATGKMSGISADIIEAAAAKLNLKVDWTENTGYGAAIDSLRDHRIDVMCSGLWHNAARGKFIAYTTPIFYNVLVPYVAIDDHRFDKDLAVANDPSIRIATMDGEISDITAKRDFPKAVEVSIPQLGQFTDMMMNVVTHKADITFTEPSFAEDFIKSNPGKLRRAQATPMQVFPVAFAVDIHETELLAALNSSLIELQGQGVIEAILQKYNADPTIYMRVAKPYTLP